MTPEIIIKLLLELDQQCLAPRPSTWGEAADIVYDLCCHASGSYRGDMGEWVSIDMALVRSAAPRQLDQPILDSIQSQAARIAELERVMHIILEEAEEGRICAIARDALEGLTSDHGKDGEK